MKRLIGTVCAIASLTCAGLAHASLSASWDSFDSTTVVQGQDLVLNGWAVDSQATGLQVNVYVDGGWGTQGYQGTAWRGDINWAEALATCYPYCGWKVRLSTANLSVGMHSISDMWVGGGANGSGWVEFHDPFVPQGHMFYVAPPSYQVHGTWDTLHNTAGNPAAAPPASAGNPTVVESMKLTGTIYDDQDGTTGLDVNVYLDGVLVTQTHPLGDSTWTAYIDGCAAGPGTHTVSVWMGSPGRARWLNPTDPAANNTGRFPRREFVVEFPARTINFTPQSDNSAYFATSILPAINNSSDIKVLQFAAGTYAFSSGQLSWFQNSPVTTPLNLCVRGAGTGVAFNGWNNGTQTTLQWTAPRGGNASLFLANAHNVHFGNLRFSSAGFLTGEVDVNGRQLGYRDNGMFLKLFGKNATVNGCYFELSPNFAMQLSTYTPWLPHDGSTPDRILVTGNRFWRTIGDGIHLLAASGTPSVMGSGAVISNNVIEESGDDAIAVYNDLWTTDGVNPSQVLVQTNAIRNSHWRGIIVGASAYVTLANNTVAGTARYGIEVNQESDPGSSAHPDHTILLNNAISGCGTLPEHETYNDTYPGSALISTRNVTNWSCSGPGC